jgi:hypothetical protein
MYPGFYVWYFCTYLVDWRMPFARNVLLAIENREDTFI